MEPYYTAPGCTFYLGDSRAVLPTLPAQSVDAMITDPPAGIAFMDKTWDHDHGGRDMWVRAFAAIFRDCRRVLKPGAHALVWALPRTSHWTATALEDAGFEVRDVIVHLYGQGFPKSLDVGKALDKAAGAERIHERAFSIEGRGDAQNVAGWTNQRCTTCAKLKGGPSRSHCACPPSAPATDLARQWDGWGTALKPASEHWILARAPLAEPTVAANVARWGTGALNVDGGRLPNPHGPGDGRRPNISGKQYGDRSLIYGGGSGHGLNAKPYNEDLHPAGRWPPNCALSHTLWCEPVRTRRVPSGGGATRYSALGLLNDDGWQLKATDSPRYHAPDGTETVEAWACHESCPVALLDAQSGLTRSVASKRGDGIGHGYHGSDAAWNTECGHCDTGGASRFFYVAKASAAERSRGLPDGERNMHPTVKPLALMKWLLTLVTPPGGVVLDPFAGSGSTLVAAVELGITAIGIEQDADSCATARQRLGYSTGVGSG